MAKPEKYLTVAEAATVLGVSKPYLYTMLRDVTCPLRASHLPGVTGRVGIVLAEADVLSEQAARAGRPRRGPVAGAKKTRRGGE